MGYLGPAIFDAESTWNLAIAVQQPLQLLVSFL
jgi:hypothetical protein